MSASLLPVWVVTVLVATLGFAQIDTAQFPTCNDNSLKWSFNDQHRSPCDVTQAMYTLCKPRGAPLPALSDGFHYQGPQEGFSTPCECSSVYYSMLSACALCQVGGSLDPWSDYIVNCTSTDHDVAVGSFPPGIPPNTSIPVWAFLDVERLNTFDPIAAKQIADSSKGDVVSGTAPPPSSPSSASPGSVTGGASSSGSRVTVTVSASPASTSSSDNGGGTRHKTNAGAIAGGVIGGLAFIGIVAAGAFFIIKRRQNDVKDDGSSSLSKPFNNNPTISSFDDKTRTTPASFSPNGGTSTSPLTQPKLYDPSDPSTFPATPPAPIMQQYGTGPPPMKVTPTNASNYKNGFGYRGISEI